MIVFGLNTMVGFACSIGIDMGYNKTHHPHPHKEAATVHVHKDGKKHRHGKEAHKHSEKPGKDDCCSDEVVKFAQVEKLTPPAEKSLHPVFFTAFAAVYYHIDVPLVIQVDRVIKYYVSGHHPPIPDIRIAIRSFQI